MLLEDCLQPRFVSQPDHRVDDLAPFEHEERWDGSDAEASGGQGVLVDVQLTDDESGR